MSWCQTFSGVQFWPLNPKVEDIRLEDIAHALSNICRFNGHCRHFYSVAQHSVLMAREAAKNLESVSLEKAILLHDSAEAYLSDIPRPIKRALGNVVVIEEILLFQIFIAFDVEWPSECNWKAIKEYDNMFLATEARDLLGPPPAEWEKLPQPLNANIEPWGPGYSKEAFLVAVQQLGMKIK